MGGNTISKVTKTLPKNPASVLQEAKASRAVANNAASTSFSSPTSSSKFSKREEEDKWMEDQATRVVGDEHRKVRLVGYNLPGEDVKYVSREDYDVMEEWNNLVKEQGVKGLEQVEREMKEMNDINVEERKYWEEQQLKEEYKISSGVAADESPDESNVKLTPEQELLMKLSGNAQVKDLTDSDNNKEDEYEKLVSQNKDDDFVHHLQNITSTFKVQTNEVEETTNTDYTNVVGKARARPLFEDIHNDSGRVYLPHNNQLNAGEDKEELARGIITSISGNNNPRAVRGRFYPDTVKDVELRKFCDLKRELEYANTEQSNKDAEALLKDFASQQAMSEETLKSILKYSTTTKTRTSHTARRLSRIYRSSPSSPSVVVVQSGTAENYHQDNSFAVEENTDDPNVMADDEQDEEEGALSPPQIITKSPTPSSSSPNFKLNLANIKSYQQQQNNSINDASLSTTSNKMSSIQHIMIKTPRGRSVSEAVLPNSARVSSSNNSLESESEFYQVPAVNSSGRFTSRTSRMNNNSSTRRTNQSSPYYIPPSSSTQSPRSILSNYNNNNNNSSSTPRTRSPANQSPRSALTPRQVTFFDESPNQLPHSANAILFNQQQQMSPDYIFQLAAATNSNNNAIGSSGNNSRSQSPATTNKLAPKHLQGNLKIPHEKYITTPSPNGGNGSKSPLAPSVYESIFGVPHSKQSLMFRHSYGNEFEARGEEEVVEDLSFNHKSPNYSNNQSNRTASPQLTPRRLAQQMTSSIKARLSPRNKAEKEGFSGLVDESSSLEMNQNVFSNDIGIIMHSHDDHLNDLKSDDESSVRHVVQDIDMHEVIATAMDGMKSHHVQTISADSINREGSTLSVSPNYLIPNMDSTESSCQSPPTTSQLVMAASVTNINKPPMHTYSTSDLTTISPGMMKGRASVGTDAEGKSVVSNHKKKQLFKVKTCCGTIELSVFKLFALAALFVNTLAFVWLAVLLSLIYVNQIDQYTLETTPSLKATQSIQYTRAMMSYLTKVTAYSSTCAPLLLQYENFTYYNETMYINRFEADYLALMSDLNASKAVLSQEIVNNLENSSFMGKDLEAYQLLKNGQPLEALKLLESNEYVKQYKMEKDTVVDPISSYFEALGLKKTYEMSFLSLMGLIVVACVFAFVVPLFIFILVCAFNRDSLHLERLNRANAVMLMDTMNNEILRDLFKKHCEIEYASENFSILEKINEYKQLCEKSFEIQVALFDIENNGPNELDVSSPVKRRPGTVEIEFPSSPISPMRRKQSSADNRDSKRMKLFKRQYSEKDLERIEQEKYEIAFEIFTDYLDVNGERSININKTLSDKVKEQMDGYAKGMIDFLSDNLFDIVELEVCVVLLDTHYRFKESLSFQKQMKIDKINKAKLVRKHRTRSSRYFQ
ncbi:predicted protein [Naegleria gruberi]|uniref:Predicted protein n=1 Tax=Naegleria gruberi TaxID=5762 RepID=D2V0E0_NAEGR|nr:uncharacterized protein NAEGRDRAFT_45674 [Naegleria gruberi]EFC49508.1 predicted protein [Naegleria gruberi]|eukprot:XP_002682252.1 predicted protein [Naegleria gruberi strain NEG-M]